MLSYELREKFLKFFEERGHKILPSSSLIPHDDPSVLLTTAGMQQFKFWFSGNEEPKFLRVATCQKCIRTSDIEEVGDNRHLTFFEMLGNFSFGDYFKQEAIAWALEFLTKELKVDRRRISTTFFGGEGNLKEDSFSRKILESLGFKNFEIKKGNRQDNFWGPTGNEGPCGPTVEFYVDGIEIWNLVFNEYYEKRIKEANKEETKKLVPLKRKGVDTGMGFERALAVLNNKKSVYETDLFEPLFEVFDKNQQINLKSKRIVLDHLRAAIFLIADGITPSNIEQGYVLRRLIRRTIRHLHLGEVKNQEKLMFDLLNKIVEIYKNIYPNLWSSKNKIFAELQKEKERFEKTLNYGLKEFTKISEKIKNRQAKEICGKDVFYLYETFGFPMELTRELAQEQQMTIDEEGFWKEFKRHQEISRAGVTKKFKGGLAELNEEAIKLHTATHLLHSALRQILGNQVKQEGSHITSERLRFDFSFPRKLTQEEIKKVENLVNQKIKEGLEVKFFEMPYLQAIKEGALAFFKERYPQIVRVYQIGNFSKEVCRGPHVKNTRELGRFKIVKEESSSAGVRRIRAILENN